MEDSNSTSTSSAMDTNSNNSEEITINVKTLNAKVFQIKVPVDITILELKTRIATSQSIPESTLRLIYQGKSLRDEKTIKFYSIKDEHTIHMVPKPNQPTPTTTTSTTTTNDETNASNSSNSPNIPRPFGGSNFVIGSISSDGTPPELSSILGNVFNSIMGSGTMGGANPLNIQMQMDPNQTNNMILNINQRISQIPILPDLLSNVSTTSPMNTSTNENTASTSTSSSTSTSTPSSTSTPNQFNQVGNVLSQTLTILNNVSTHPTLPQLTTLLQQESTISDISLRNQTQSLSHQTGQLFQQLSVLFSSLASSLNQVQMGEIPGQAQLTRQNNPNISANVSTTITSTQQGSSTAVNGGMQGPITMSVPVISISQRQVNPNGVPNPNSPNPNPNQPNQPNLGPLFSALSSLMGSQNQGVTNNTPNTATGTANRPPVNPLQNMLQMFAPLMQQQQQQQQQQQAQSNTTTSTPTPTSTQPTSSSTSTSTSTPNTSNDNLRNDLGSFNQLFGTLTQMANGNITTSNPNPNSNPNDSKSTVNSNPSSSTPNVNPNFTLNPNAALMSQTFSAVNQAILNGNTTNPPQSMSSVIGTIAQGMKTENNNGKSNGKEDTVIGEILQRVMSALTVPDMLSIMSGNWEPLERVHPILKVYVEEILKGDHSNAKIEKLSEEIVDSLKQSLNEKSLPEDIKKRVRPGYEITTLSLHTIKKHTTKLIHLIVTHQSPNITNNTNNNNNNNSNNQKTPFAFALQEWTTHFVGELVSVLSQALHGGVHDAAIVIKFFLQEKLSMMGLGPEFASMGTNMVTSYIMNTYANSQQVSQHNTNAHQDPSTWNNVIAVDEIRQSNSEPQKPLSDTYLGGPNNKKRKVVNKVNTNPQSLMQDRLKEAVITSNLSENDADRILKNMPQSISQGYTQQIRNDVSKKLESDSNPDDQSQSTKKAFGKK